MNDRERLIELFHENEIHFANYINQAMDKVLNDIYTKFKNRIEFTTDYLISHGVTVQKHGRWIDGAENFTCGNHNAECSVCHCNVSWNGCDEDFNYCPNCGAKMDEGEA